MSDDDVFDVLAEQARARRSDPETSHEAARSISTEDLRRSQHAVLECFRRYGAMTDVRMVEQYEEAGMSPRQSESGLRTRRNELVEAGALRDSGLRRRLPSNRRAIVWEAATPAAAPPQSQRPTLRAVPTVTAREVSPEEAAAAIRQGADVGVSADGIEIRRPS